MSDATRATVVVPVHGRAGLTKRCLERVLADLPRGCEVVVVDDASLDETPQVLDGFGGKIRVLRLQENGGYGAACNAGAEVAKGEHLVFLNNDTEPEPGWLEALLSHATACPEAWVVGAKLLYPTGAVQHAGVVFGQDGYPHNLYAGFPADHPAVNRVRRLQAVTGACMLVRRDAFERAGGFDRGFHNSMEDVDLCLRIGEAGSEVHYCPSAVVIHLESATRGREEKFERSVSLYRERWRDRVRRDDLATYAEDGLIEVEYPSAHPLRISVSPLLAAIEREDGQEAELEPLLRRQGRRIEDLQRELVRLAAELVDRGAEVKLPSFDREDAVAAIRAQVERAVPEGAKVLLVSRGDSELLRLGNREADHFPAGADGRYLGHHPADDSEAVELLEAERRQGAEYLVLPAAESWWLSHYRRLAARLEEGASAEHHEACTIYRLEPRPALEEARR
ncbi:MAG TPA: glycosyltransferase family 2 protein [Solirubrobacterales bacterium]|jgi:GT2 family glycosyltransferase|nr:glycosyltransferase family 2 protein [Solirubrobacterales bacterium]